MQIESQKNPSQIRSKSQTLVDSFEKDVTKEPIPESVLRPVPIQQEACQRMKSKIKITGRWIGIYLLDKL